MIEVVTISKNSKNRDNQQPKFQKLQNLVK